MWNLKIRPSVWFSQWTACLCRLSTNSSAKLKSVSLLPYAHGLSLCCLVDCKALVWEARVSHGFLNATDEGIWHVLAKSHWFLVESYAYAQEMTIQLKAQLATQSSDSAHEIAALKEQCASAETCHGKELAAQVKLYCV